MPRLVAVALVVACASCVDSDLVARVPRDVRDVFVQDANGVYAHYDGHVISQLRTPNTDSASSNPFAVTPTMFYVFDLETDQLEAVPRMPVSLPAPVLAITSRIS